MAPRKRTGTTVENLGTVALRAGHAWDRSLVYVKGGRPRCLFFADRVQEHDKQEHTTIAPALSL